jgi:hypothetical protein
MYDIIINESKWHILHGPEYAMDPTRLNLGEDSCMIIPVYPEDYLVALEYYKNQYPLYKVYEIIE